MAANYVSALHAKHAGLETRIRNESARPAPDSLLIAMLKKRKLRLKQEITQTTG